MAAAWAAGSMAAGSRRAVWQAETSGAQMAGFRRIIVGISVEDEHTSNKIQNSRKIERYETANPHTKPYNFKNN